MKLDIVYTFLTLVFFVMGLLEGDNSYCLKNLYF